MHGNSSASQSNRSVSTPTSIDGLPTTSVPRASPGGSQPIVDNCGHPRAEPSTLTLACGDGDISISNITWSEWNTNSGEPGTLAGGTGTFNWDNCDPNRAQGQDSAVPLQITLSNLVSYEGSEVWSYLDVRSLPDRAGLRWAAAAYRWSEPARTTGTPSCRFPGPERGCARLAGTVIRSSKATITGRSQETKPWGNFA